jgi:AraC family transcriptional regulator
MKYFTLKEGLYAAFNCKGSGSDNSTFQNVFGEWLLNSMYQIGDRPHFETLGKNIKIITQTQRNKSGYQ